MARPKREDGRNARTVANNKYNNSVYDRLAVNVRKGEREKVKAHAEKNGESTSGLINRLLAEEIPDFNPIEKPQPPEDGSDKT